VEPVSIISITLVPLGAVAAISLGVLDGYVTIDEEHRGLYERFGEYKGYKKSGLHFKAPVIDRIRQIKVAEQSVNISPSDMITSDNLNAEVDAVVYYPSVFS